MREDLAVKAAVAETAVHQVTITCGGQSFPFGVSSSHGPASLESGIQELCGVPLVREQILSLPLSARQVLVTSSNGASLHLTPPLRLYESTDATVNGKSYRCLIHFIFSYDKIRLN